MARTAIAFAFVAVSTIAFGCGKDVEDPGFTASASGTMSTSAGTSSGGEDTTTAPATTQDSNSNSATTNDTETADATTDDPSMGTSGPTDTDAAGCGDGAISPGEQCDGADLQGFTCMSLGLNGGTLACDPVMCTFDTSMCMSTSGGTSG